MTVAIDQLVSTIRSTWPEELNSAVSDNASGVGLALANMIALAARGEVASLPYVQMAHRRVFWLSIGPDTPRLLEYADDLRSWILPLYDTQGTLDVVPSGAPGRLADLVASISPHGYLRWQSSLGKLSPILERLHSMHRFLQSKPEIAAEAVPSLSTLRFRFTAALRLGDWIGAEATIDEIDRWNLEQAQKTMQMRVRLLDARGAYGDLVELVERHQLWAVTNPRRISAAILLAIHRTLLHPLEDAGRYSDALEVLRNDWFPRLTQAIADTVEMPEVASVQAYASCIDNDAVGLERLVSSLEPGLAAFARSRLPISQTTTLVASTQSDLPEPPKPVGDAFWRALQSGVRSGRQERVRALLEALDSNLLEDVQFIADAPDALLELFSDPELEGSAASRMLLHDTLTALIDAVVDAPGFPRLQHLDLYVALCEGLVYLRGAAANEADSQLLLGLVSAIIYLTPASADRCDAIVRSWWGQRPTVSRLPWLAGVLDAVAPLHPDPQNLSDLFGDAMGLAARKHHLLAPSELRTWRRIADSLELPAELTHAALLQLSPAAGQLAADALRGAGLRRIAIVSLQEAGAREAAIELAERSGAEVKVVNSLVQGTMTRAAESADLILFVWAACSHAVYRAFDNCRDRLAYVQGTGASSIIGAAERWVHSRKSGP